MLKVANIESWGWEAAIRGMRNPMNSWDKSDSEFYTVDTVAVEDRHLIGRFSLGQNDLDLACRLIKAGPEHAKFLRMIHVQMDITAPLYWWKEADTYKVGTIANSCSTMHRLHANRFKREDFSIEHLENCKEEHWMVCMDNVIASLNVAREKYLETKDKKYWWQMIQLLPSSYNQLRTWDGSMQTVLSILKQRKGHKLDEWEQFRQECFDNITYCKEFYTAMTGKDE